MKTRYLIVACSLIATFSVFYLYYYAVLASARRVAHLPGAPGDVFMNAAMIALAASLGCLLLTLVASLVKALRSGPR